MSDEHRPEHGATRATGKWVFAGFLLVAGFFLVTEHQAHLFGVLPFLLLLACPLMHIFGHKHVGHGNTDQKPDATTGNVWVSAHHLFALRMACQPFPRCGFSFA